MAGTARRCITVDQPLLNGQETKNENEFFAFLFYYLLEGNWLRVRFKIFYNGRMSLNNLVYRFRSCFSAFGGYFQQPVGDGKLHG